MYIYIHLGNYDRDVNHLLMETFAIDMGREMDQSTRQIFSQPPLDRPRGFCERNLIIDKQLRKIDCDMTGINIRYVTDRAYMRRKHSRVNFDHFALRLFSTRRRNSYGRVAFWLLLARAVVTIEQKKMLYITHVDMCERGLALYCRGFDALFVINSL